MGLGTRIGVAALLLAGIVAGPAQAADEPESDLKVKKLTATYEASPVRQLLVSLKVINSGDDMPGKGKLTLKLSDANGKVAQTTAKLPAIDGGKKRSLSLNLELPTEVSESSHALEACAKPPKGAKDPNKRNSCDVLAPIFIPKADGGPTPKPGPTPDPGPTSDTTAPETTITAGPAEGGEVFGITP